MKRFFKIIKLFTIVMMLTMGNSVLFAQNASNIRVHQRNKDIIITYDLKKSSCVKALMATGTDTTFVPLHAVEGAVGNHVRAGKNKEIIWHPLEEKGEFVAENVRFKVETLGLYEHYILPKSSKRLSFEGKSNIETFLTVDMAYAVSPQLSFGIMLGQTYKGIGWYTNVRSNFHKSIETNDLECEAGGYIGKTLPFYSGKTYSSLLVVNAGIVLDIFDLADFSPYNRFNTLGLYLGGGYGHRLLFWETINGDWIKYSPTSYRGFSGNLGLIGSISGFTLKAGVNTISFKYLEFEIGLGWMF